MPDSTEERDYLEGERGPVMVPLRKARKSSMIAFASIVFITIVVAAIVYVALVRHHNSPKAAKAQKELMTNEAAVPHKTFLPAPPAPPPAGSSLNQAGQPGAAPEILAAKDKPSPEDDLHTKRLGSPLMPSQALQTAPGGTPKQREAGTDSVMARPGSLSSSLQSTDTPARAAGLIVNRNLTLTRGTFIDCALETRLVSTVPGITSCVVTRNIYSDNGKVLLIERGSKLTGEYQGGMQQGQARIFVLWNRVKTPHGVIVNLDSPGTDPLGGSGMPGYVDTHFGERFGGAILLSVISDSLAIAANLTNRAIDSETVVYNNTSAQANQMAAEALRNTINIPPTLYKNQGDRINVIVARDLSFEGVYDIRLQ